MLALGRVAGACSLPYRRSGPARPCLLPRCQTDHCGTGGRTAAGGPRPTGDAGPPRAVRGVPTGDAGPPRTPSGGSRASPDPRHLDPVPSCASSLRVGGRAPGRVAEVTRPAVKAVGVGPLARRRAQCRRTRAPTAHEWDPAWRAGRQGTPTHRGMDWTRRPGRPPSERSPVAVAKRPLTPTVEPGGVGLPHIGCVAGRAGSRGAVRWQWCAHALGIPAPPSTLRSGPGSSVPCGGRRVDEWPDLVEAAAGCGCCGHRLGRVSAPAWCPTPAEACGPGRHGRPTRARRRPRAARTAVCPVAVPSD